jgi:UDP-glucose 4-epimerase
MRYFVTGAGGFIGSSLVDRLLRLGHEVHGFDNFSTGQRRFLDGARSSSLFKLIEGDLLDLPGVTEAMRACQPELVFHLAANADVRFGIQHPRRDLEQNTIATHNVLEAMRAAGARRIAFSSTGSVYGETKVIPTPENAPFPVQSSLYGVSKLAGEGLISAYCEGFGFQGLVFRFVSILGDRYTHGHVFDFYKSLRSDPSRLHILGDGKQRKSYLEIGDCLNAMLLAIEKTPSKFEIYNLGTDEYCTVNDSAGWICEHLGLAPARTYSGGDRGWIGDNPFIFLDCSKVRRLGWKPKLAIHQSVLRTVDYLRSNPWVLERN